MGTSLLGFIPTRLHCGGKSFRKAFRILAFDWRKSRWVVEQDFMGIFGSTLHVVFFCPFLRSSSLNHAHSAMVWKIFSPYTSQMTKFSFTVKTDDVTSDRRGVDPHGRFRGEWINGSFVFLCFSFFLCVFGQGDKASAILSKRYYYLAIKRAKYCNITVTGTSTLSKQNPNRKSEAKSTAQLQMTFNSFYLHM